MFQVVELANHRSCPVTEIANEFQEFLQGWQTFLHSEDFCNALGT